MVGPTFLVMVVVRVGTSREESMGRYQRISAALGRAGIVPVDVGLPGVWEAREPVTTRDVARVLHGLMGAEDEVRFYVPIRRGELATYRVAGGAL
jgi:hypothetical protein